MQIKDYKKKIPVFEKKVTDLYHLDFFAIIPVKL